MSDEIINAISNAADRYNVDPNLALNVAHQESGFNQSRVSPKGAIGVMQLMPDTAKTLGVDPHNMDQNIDGGVKYLSQLSDKYKGDPKLIAAAYNAGPGAVDKHGGVPPYKETQNYVNNVVNNSHDFINQQLPHSTQLDAAFGLPSGSGSTANTSAAPKTASTSASLPPTAALDAAFGIQRGQPASPQAKPQSPGTQLALTKYSAPRATTDMLGHPIAQQDPNSTFNATMGGLTNQLVSGGLPLGVGALAGLNTGINNFLYKNFGIGDKPQYSMSDAFSGAKQAAAANLNSAAAAHPIANAIGNTAGFVGSPVFRTLGAGKAALEARGGLAATIAGRAALGGAQMGVAGATAGAGEAASNGATASQIGAHALEYGIPNAVFGTAGELAAPWINKGAAALVGNEAHPALATAARVGAHALGSGAVGAVAGGLTGGVKGAVQLGTLAALTGSTGGIVKPGEMRSISPAASDLATEHLAKTVSPNLDIAAEHFENATHPTTVEAAGENAPALLQTATQHNVNSVGNLQRDIAGRQNQTQVKSNLTNDINNVVGGSIEPTNLANSVADDVSNTTNIHPAEAEMNADNYIESKKKNSPLWRKVDANDNNPVTTPEHSALLENEPVVRTALAQAQRDLGLEGNAPNPNFKPPEVELKTPDNINNEDIQEVLKDRQGADVQGRNVPFPGPTQETADYLNNKRGVGENDEPETVPTQKAWILAERYLGKMIPRDNFGKVDYSKQAGTFEVQNSQQDVNAANKKNFEGLKEAKAETGETKSFERNKDLGNNLSTTKTSETPEAFDKRYQTLSDPDKEATQHGYLQEFYRKLQNNPIAAANEYSGPIHQKFQKTMFGEEGANQVQGALYKAKLAKVINGINANGGAVEEKHLNELNKFVTDEGERSIQDKIFGKEKANQLRAAITKQVELAKSGSDISKFSSNSKAAEKEHDVVQTAALGFVSHGFHGALKGVSTTSGLKSAGHVLGAIKQGRMTPEVQQALADKLAQSPQQTAKDIRDLRAKKQNMPMSKSTLAGDLAKHAFKGLGYLTGKATANAFNGISQP